MYSDKPGFVGAVGLRPRSWQGSRGRYPICVGVGVVGAGAASVHLVYIRVQLLLTYASEAFLAELVTMGCRSNGGRDCMWNVGSIPLMETRCKSRIVL